MPPPRILILRLSALGDIIHALPLLGALRAKFPDAFIGWLVEPAGASLVQGHPLLDAVHVVPKKQLKTETIRALRGPVRELLAEIKKHNYEIAIDVQGLTKSAAWSWMAGIPRRIGFARPDARELAPWMANEIVRPRPEALHVVERNLELLRPLGIDLAAAVADAGEMENSVAFPIHLPESAKARASALLGDDPAPLAALICGAGWATKRWPPERFGQLARSLARDRGFRIVLPWGPGEQPLVAEALRAAGSPEPDFAAAALPGGPGVFALPATSFLELGAVLARASLAVGGDTGPVHLAAALGARTVCLMGPLDARRNGAFGPNAATIQHAIPRKPPRGVNHREWCDPATRMDGIAVEEVLAKCAVESPPTGI